MTALAAMIPARVVVFTVTAVPYLIADTTLLAVDDGLVKFTPEMLVVMFVTGAVGETGVVTVLGVVEV